MCNKNEVDFHHQRSDATGGCSAEMGPAMERCIDVMLYVSRRKNASLAGWQLFSFTDWTSIEGKADTRGQPCVYTFVQGDWGCF